MVNGIDMRERERRRRLRWGIFREGELRCGGAAAKMVNGVDMRER